MKTLILSLAILLLPPQPNLERTVVVALKELRQFPHADEWEYSGFVVLRHGELFYAMAPYTDQARDHVLPDLTERLVPGDKPVAMYHNHPCYSTSHFTDYFSRPHLIQARFFDIPTFMLDNCTGDVHEFSWKWDREAVQWTEQHVSLSDGTRKVYWMTQGRVVGNIGVASPNLDTPPMPHGRTTFIMERRR